MRSKRPLPCFTRGVSHRQLAQVALMMLLLLVGTAPRVEAQPPDLQAEQTAYVQATQSIEQFRKIPVMVRILDQTDNPLYNVQVDYAQKSNDFLIGIYGSQWALPTNASAWPLWSDLCSASNIVELDWQVWSNTEPQRNVFSWSAADLQFQEVLDHCPDAHFILMFSDLTSNLPIDPSWIQLNNLTNPSAFQQFKLDLYQYVYNVVQRYSSKVLLWVTENELNLPQAQSFLGNSVQRAIEVDQVVVAAIRAADSQAHVVLSSGLAESIANQPNAYAFANEALQAGIKVDGISFEAYPGWSDLVNGVPETPLFYMQFMQKLAGLGRPVFIQETGYPSVVPTCSWGTCWPAWNGIASEELQADWLKYIVTFAFGTANVMGVLWPFGVDSDPALGGQFQGFGLITTDGHPKQDYYTYTQLIQNYTVSGMSRTDSNGEISFGGFAGNYSFKITGPPNFTGNFTVHVDEYCASELVVVTGNIGSVTSTCSDYQSANHGYSYIVLQGGWNLVSLPTVPDNPNIAIVLQTIISNVNIVWCYSPATKAWSFFKPGPPASGTLKTMQDGVGYWILMSGGDLWRVTGTVIPLGSSHPSTYPLSLGWNLLGFEPAPNVGNETVSAYLSSITGSYDPNNVWLYDNSNGAWIRTTGSTWLEPGQAVWILIASPTTLRP